MKRPIIEWAKAAFTLILLIVACTGVFLTRNSLGPWTELYCYLFILPILIASFSYGRVTGLSVALVSSIVTGSLAIGTPDPLASPLFQRLLILILIFNGVAIVTTELAGRERVQKNRYQDLFEGSPLGLYRTTPSGIILELNPAMTRMLGYPDPAPLIGANISGIYLDPEDGKRWQAWIEQEEIVQGFETQFRRHDGTIIWVRDTVRTARDVDGFVQFYDGCVEDITERRQAEEELRESEEFNRTLVENLPDIIAIYDSRGIVRFANRAGLNLLVSPESNVVGEPILSFVTDYQRSEVERKMGERLSGAAMSPYEVDIRAGGGKVMTVLLQVVPIRYRNDPGILVLMTDITGRKQQEQALQIAKQKLDLMNLVAWHDVYNKITGLRGYVELSRKHITDPQAEEFRTREEELLKVIHQQILYTREYQQIGEKPPRWHPLARLLYDVCYTGVAGSIRIINEAGDLEIFADPVIEKVFWHLIDNSAKHGETVTEVRITARESASGCTLVYQDNGVGIPEHKRKDLFTKSFGKMTGFDLFFVHDILDIYGMKIDETGEPGKGARFEITVPKGLYRFIHQRPD